MFYQVGSLTSDNTFFVPQPHSVVALYEENVIVLGWKESPLASMFNTTGRKTVATLLGLYLLASLLQSHVPAFLGSDPSLDFIRTGSTSFRICQQHLRMKQLKV